MLFSNSQYGAIKYASMLLVVCILREKYQYALMVIFDLYILLGGFYGPLFIGNKAANLISGCFKFINGACEYLLGEYL